MMKMPGEISSGVVKKPEFLFLWGQPGIGKSSFAAEFPKPYFLDLEHGTLQIDGITRNTGLKSFSDVRNMLKWLLLEKHDFLTVVIDALDTLEPMIFDFVCSLDGSTSIDNAQGGFGRGHTKAVQCWAEILNDLSLLNTTKNMNVVLLGHAQIKTFHDPTLPTPYERFVPKLNDKAAARIIEKCDAVLYATYKTQLKVDRDAKKTRAFGDSERVIHVEYRPGFIAKNRYNLPPTLPLSFKAFKDAIFIDTTSLKKYCLELSEKITDKDKKEAAIKYIEECGTNPRALRAAEKRLVELTE